MSKAFSSKGKKAVSIWWGKYIKDSELSYLKLTGTKVHSEDDQSEELPGGLVWQRYRIGN